MLPDSPVACTIEEDDHGLYLLQAASAIGLFFCILLGAKAFFYFAARDESESGRKVLTETDAPPPENFNALMWGYFATFCCGTNYNVVLAGSLDDFATMSGSVASAGLWVGLWAAGAMLSLPVFFLIPMRKCGVSMKLQAIVVVTGNTLMVLGMLQRQAHWMLVGRFITGLEGGIKYTLDFMALQLTPASGTARVDALFNARMSAGAGNAVGMILQPALWILASRLAPRWLLLDFFPDDSVARMALPLIAMSVYGLVYLVGLCATFRDPTPYEPLSSPEELERRPITWGTWAGISATVACQLTRNLKSSILKSAVVLVMTMDFCTSEIISPLLFAFQVSFIMSRSIVKSLVRRFSRSQIQVMKALEFSEALSLLALFRLVSIRAVDMFVYLLGLAFFFNSNTAGASLSVSLGAQSTNESHRLTSKRLLTVYTYLARMLAWLLGPVIAFYMASQSLGLNAFTGVVALLTLAQSSITYVWLRGAV